MNSYQIEAALQHLNDILPSYTNDLPIPIIPWGGFWQVMYFESRPVTYDIDIQLPFFRSVDKIDTSMAFLNAIVATSKSPCIQRLEGRDCFKAKWMNLDVIRKLPPLDFNTFNIANLEMFKSLTNIQIYYPNWYTQLAVKVSRFQEIDQKDIVIIMQHLTSCGDTWETIRDQTMKENSKLPNLDICPFTTLEKQENLKVIYDLI